ncbi:MAG: regulatory protein SipA [Pleurocapsa sp.]
MNSEQKKIKVGDRIRIIALPEYIKTAEPMPMLRPPSLLTVGELGTVLDRRPGGYYGIRFTQGAFLLEGRYIEIIDN